VSAPRMVRAAMIAGAAFVAPGLTACNPRIGEFEERGDRYSAQGSYADALVEYRADLAASPNRLNGLYGAARAARICGSSDRSVFFSTRLMSGCAMS